MGRGAWVGIGLVCLGFLRASALGAEPSASVTIRGPLFSTVVVDRSDPTQVSESRDFPQYGGIGPFGPTHIDGLASQTWSETHPTATSTLVNVSARIGTTATSFNANTAYGYTFRTDFSRAYTFNQAFDFSLVGSVSAVVDTDVFDSSYANPVVSARVSLQGNNLAGGALFRSASAAPQPFSGQRVDQTFSIRGVAAPGTMTLDLAGLSGGTLTFFQSTLGGTRVKQVHNASYDVTLKMEPHKAKTFAILLGSSDELGVRGDLDVENVAARLNWVAPENLYRKTVNYADPAQDVAAWVQGAVNDIKNNGLMPGDTVLFYYSGHGSYTGAPQGRASDPGVDETLDVQSETSPGITDNTLTGILSDPMLEGAKKLVILDSCHGGGFWSADRQGESDLGGLPKTVLLAAAREDGQALSDFDGTGRFTNALLPNLSAGATYGDLIQGIQNFPGDFVSGPFRDQGFGSGFLQPEAESTFDVNPSDTLDPAYQVPEPGLLGLGMVVVVGRMLGGRRNRRA